MIGPHNPHWHNLSLIPLVLDLLQIANKDDLLAATASELARKEDLLRGTKKTTGRKNKKLSTTHIHTPAHKRDVFVAFVKPSENLITPVRRKAACMPPRKRELSRAGFVPADVAAADLPNARHLWSAALAVMKKQGLISYWPIRCDEGNKFIHAYKMNKDMCVEGVIRELGCSAEEGAWLAQVTAAAGLLPKSQTLIDKYLKPTYYVCDTTSQILMDKYMNPTHGEIDECENGHVELISQ